jgi:repressor LexA
MNELSPKQRKVLERLEAILARAGALPPVAELARELGVHYVSLRQHLQALDKKGYLEFKSRGVGQAPIIRLLRPPAVPVLGSIPAGPLSEAFEEVEGYLPLQPRPGLFALRVSGDSMADLIQDRDVVLLQKGAMPVSGEICAVRVYDSEVTLKYLDWSHGAREVVLRPHNPRYPLHKVRAEEVVIEGVYRGLLRGDITEELFQS